MSARFRFVTVILKTGQMNMKAVDVMPGKVTDDLTFEIKAAPGRSRVALLGQAPGWAIRSVRYRGVDVTVGGSQKGLMLPPGLGFNAISERALAASKTARLPRSYWDWQEMLRPNASGFFPYTAPSPLLRSWNLTIQRQLSQSMVFDIGYVGSNQSHLPFTADLNQVPENLLGPNDAAFRPYKFQSVTGNTAPSVKVRSQAGAVVPKVSTSVS